MSILFEGTATDGDLPADTLATDSLENLQAESTAKDDSKIDVDTDDEETVDLLELPGADLSTESLTVHVVPQLADEFTCAYCHLIHHRSQKAGGTDDAPLCRDCAD